MNETTITRPLWVAFEGGDGSGKSTQARRLADRIGAVITREPGGTELGQLIRNNVQHADVNVSPVAEMLLYAADRAQHVAEIVRPALDAGLHVVSDRSVWSSFAFQHGGRGLDAEIVKSVNDIALDGLWPDLVVFCDVSPEIAAGRVDRTIYDRIEAAGTSLQSRARDTFLAVAAANPDTWLVVNSDQAGIDELADAIAAWVLPKLHPTVAQEVHAS